MHTYGTVLAIGSDIAVAEWPGLKMTKVVGTSDIYQVQVTSNMPHYYDFNYIIFNDGHSGDEAKQTYDIRIDKFENNNKLYALGNYNVPGEKRVYINVDFGGGPVYVYLWNNNNTSIKNANWPGVNITANKISNAGYYVTFPNNRYTHIIVNNGDGGGRQTADLQIPSSQDMTLIYQDKDNGGGYFEEMYRGGNWTQYVPPKTLLPSHTH